MPNTALGASWPDSCVAVFADALPEPLLAAVAADSDSLAACEPNFWVPRSAILPVSRESDPQRTLVETVVCSLWDRVLSTLLPADSWAGAEWWCQVYNTPGRGLDFHYDKDEHRMAAAGVMANPELSCVLYLNTDAECANTQKLNLGATAVLEQRYDSASQTSVPETSRNDVLVWPAHNTLCVFDGRLSHGVLDWHAAGPLRRTLLVNWWTAQPQEVQRCSAVTYASVHGLAAAGAVDAVSSEPHARRLCIPVVNAELSEEQGPMAVDDLVRDAGHSGAVAVAIAHPGSTLIQLEDAAAAAVAVIVPDELLQSGDED